MSRFSCFDAFHLTISHSLIVMTNGVSNLRKEPSYRTSAFCKPRPLRVMRNTHTHIAGCIHTYVQKHEMYIHTYTHTNKLDCCRACYRPPRHKSGLTQCLIRIYSVWFVHIMSNSYTSSHVTDAILLIRRARKYVWPSECRLRRSGPHVCYANGQRYCSRSPVTMWHGSFVCVPWLIHRSAMTRVCSCICVCYSNG